MSLTTRILSRLLHLPPATYPRLTRRHDLRMTLSDGTVLLADRWYPEGHETGLPTLLMRTPYGHSGVMTFEAPLLAERGYNVIVQSVRGTHGSGGVFDPFAPDQRDGPEVLRWIREQPWCDGRLATWGGSYCGYTQLAAAATAEPGLIDAMSVDVSCADLRCLVKPYGAFTLETTGGWIHGLDPEGRRSPAGSLVHLATSRGTMARAWASLPLRETDRILADEEMPFYRTWIDLPSEAPYWDSLDARRGHRAQTAPVALHAGWFDIFGPGQLADAAEMLQAGRDVRLTVGPWNHAGGMGVRFRDNLRFFDETLRGAPTRKDPRPVRVQLYGDDKRWWALPTWPAPSDPQRWHLTTDGRLDAVPPASTGRVEWVDDPADPAPSCGGATLQRGGAVDNAKREARGDVMVFTSAPLGDDVVVLGTPRFRAHADADVPSYDVVVRLCVVDEKGVSRNVSDGMQRIEGGEADADIGMWPTGVRVRRGQRLRVQVAGAMHPLWARNLHSGEDPAKGTTAVPAHQALLLGPDTPAFVELPVVQLGATDLASDAP